MGKITEENRRKLETAINYEDADITDLIDNAFTDKLDSLFTKKRDDNIRNCREDGNFKIIYK